MKFALMLSAAAIVLTGCADRESPEDVAKAQANMAANEATAIRAATVAADEAVTVAGDWSGDEGSAAYGPADGEPLFSASCDATQREIVFSRAVAVAGESVDMKVGTGAEIKVVEANVVTEPLPMVSGRLSVSDPVVRAIAQSDDNVTVQIGDGEIMIAPAGAPLRQVIENCG
ncbi:MAG: hypothetical protein GW859_00495 [Sphingomonadales bacterium]|nr:hypothetical protein [Sphingomonadales bacterium]